MNSINDTIVALSSGAIKSAICVIRVSGNNSFEIVDSIFSNKKVHDLKNRISIMEENHANLAISIHQNSYSDNAIHGAQVFYYTTSNSGKILAQTISEILLSPHNTP